MRCAALLLAPGLALLGPVALSACRGGVEAASRSDVAGLLEPREKLLLLRRVPASPAEGSPGAPAPVPELLAAVVQMPDGKLELRIAEQRPQGRVRTHSSRPGDEFRNLTVEDLNADGQPEIVSTWTGGQLEVVEVLGRSVAGDWNVLLQNAGQVIEERHQPDRSTSFWITSRTYEEEPGQPPVYQTTVYRWDGAAFTQAAEP